MQTVDCGDPICCIKYAWGAWGACSTSCGQGERARYQTSTCSDGKPVDVETELCDGGGNTSC